ncbi:hypothetical protein E4U51_000898, partial [Claviceps purpurea]
MSLPAEQQDLEGDLQNLSLESPPPMNQAGPSNPPSEETPDLEELHPSLEPLRKHISPAWKDVAEDSDVESTTETNDYIIYHYNYYVQHGITHDRLRDQFCDDFHGWTTEMWDKATKPIRSHARDFLTNNGVPLDVNVRKIGDKLVALMQQNHAALTTAYSESLRRSDSQLDPNNPANRTTTPLSFRTAVHLATQHSSASVPPSQAPSIQAPSIQAPSIQAPSVQAPSVQAPSVQAPSSQAPPFQAPSAQAAY